MTRNATKAGHIPLLTATLRTSTLLFIHCAKIMDGPFEFHVQFLMDQIDMSIPLARGVLTGKLVPTSEIQEGNMAENGVAEDVHVSLIIRQ